MRSLVFALLAGVLALSPGQNALAQTPAPYPTSGVDFSGIDGFYTIADLLSRDTEPTEAQWSALLGTPGYRLVEIDNRGIRKRIDLALKPSRRTERDSILKRDGDQAAALRHIIRAAAARDSVQQTRSLLERSTGDSVARALIATKRFLPAGIVERTPTPFIAFAIFAADGYAEQPGILLDPLYVHDNGLVELLSHELHHMYAGTIDRTRPFAELMAMKPVPTDGALFFAIFHLRNEGIADMVDKPRPLVAQSPSMQAYVTRYNAAYERTPQLLRTFDSLLVGVADHPGTAGPAGQAAQRLFVSNGHPNGAYMARTILETLGADSLMNGVRSPIGFVRTYAEAEIKRGNPPPFSPKALALFQAMEDRYIKP
jgi:hypothetical protein